MSRRRRKIFSSASGGGDDSLQGTIASACCDLDATMSGSYSGSGQTWANLIASPADGVGQTDYDAWFGTENTSSSDDPTFTGSAGDSGAYMSLDGGDFFEFKSIVSGSALAQQHRTDVSGTWVALVWRSPTTPAGFIRLFGNTAGTDRGIGAHYDTGEELDVVQRGDSANVSILSNAATVSGSTDYLFIYSWDGTSSSNNVKIWVNSDTSTSTQSATFNSSTTDETSNPYFIGATNNGGSPLQPMQNGSRIYAFSCGNEFLDDTKAAAIRDAYEARHSRTY